MAKLNINIGTADKGDGDPLRVAFSKVNDNFTELYTALGLDVAPLNLGAFEFTGSVMSTTDSSAITIDQATTITSNLTVGGDILPSTNLGGNLGSPTQMWKSLYVSNNTIYINNVPLRINASLTVTDAGELYVDGQLFSGGGGSISDFGEGFTDSLDAGKITTSKLYNENPNQGLNNQYVLEVTNGGVVVLPDQSIINGATLKTVAGNYAGITAGPASPAGKDEDSWVWVDNNGATIATKYSTDAHTWTFNNSGALTFPQGTTIATADGTDAFIIDGAVDKDIQIYTYSGPTPTAHGWTFGADGNLTLPAGGAINNTDGIKLVTDRGTLAIGTNMELPGVAGHFHIAFNGSNSNPPASDLFLGDDYNYVKLPGSQLNPDTFGVEIGTDNRNLGLQNIEVDDVDELVPPGGVWRLFIDHEDYPNLGSSVSVGDTVTTSWGTPITATITDVVEEPGNSWKIHVAQDITAGFEEPGATQTVSFGTSGLSYTWRFGTDGDLAIPPGKTIRDAMTGDDLLDIKVVRQDTAPTADNGTLWFNTVEGRLYIKYSDVWVDAAPLVQPPPDTDIDVVSITFPDASVLTSVADLTPDRLVSGVHELVLGTDGTLTLPNGMTIDSYGTSGTNATVTIGGDNTEIRIDNDGAPPGFLITTDKTGESYQWLFGPDGSLTLPTGGHIGPSGGKGLGTTYGGANDHLVSLTSYYDSGLYSSCVTAYADGTLNITAYNDGGPNPAKIWTFANDGTLTIPGDILSENGINIDINLSDSTLRRWRFGEEGDLNLPQGSTIGETATTTVITPPGALPGQSLVIRPTIGIFSLSTDHPDGFVPGSSITITTSSVHGGVGTLDYEFTGATAQQLGRATTGSLTDVDLNAPVDLTWTIPAQSSMTTFTFTLVSGTGFGGVTGLPIEITVTLDGSAVSENNHVHLLSGNPATTDLYLGDDDQYVKIEKNGGDVVIGTDTDTNHWTFDTSGGLTLPQGGVIDETPAGETLTLVGAGLAVVNQTYTKVGSTLYSGSNGITINNQSGAGTWYCLEENDAKYTSTDLITWSNSTGGLPVPTGTINTLPETVNITVGTETWAFGGDGSTTLPGVLVNSTVVKDGPAPNTTGVAQSLSANFEGDLTGLTDSTYGPFTLDVVTFSIVVFGGVLSGFSNITVSGESVVNAVIGTIDSGEFNGVAAGTTITITVASVVQPTPTALDLTKSVNKLAEGLYSLADGVEGQIMYLVLRNGSVPANVAVSVANSRITGISYIGGSTLLPFQTYDGTSSVVDNTGMCTLIFTEDHWQQQGGYWDYT